MHSANNIIDAPTIKEESSENISEEFMIDVDQLEGTGKGRII